MFVLFSLLIDLFFCFYETSDIACGEYKKWERHFPPTLGVDCHGFTSRERCDSEQPQMEDKSKFACKGTKNFWDVQIHLQIFRMESPKSYARMGRAEALVAR